MRDNKAHKKVLSDRQEYAGVIDFSPASQKCRLIIWHPNHIVSFDSLERKLPQFCFLLPHVLDQLIIIPKVQFLAQLIDIGTG